jgi:hypothetical protein
MKAITAIGLVLALLAVGTVEAAAQTPAQSFADLQPTLKIGESVFVTDDKDTVTRGRVVSIVGKQLEIDGARSSRLAGLGGFLGLSGGLLGRALRGSNQRYLFTEDAVRRIENEDPAGTPGGLIGLGAGAVAVWLMHSNTRDSEELGLLLLDGVALSLSIVAGMAIDWSIRRSIYVSPQGGGLSFAPVLGPTRLQVSAAVRFS